MLLRALFALCLSLLVLTLFFQALCRGLLVVLLRLLFFLCHGWFSLQLLCWVTKFYLLVEFKAFFDPRKIVITTTEP